MNTTQQRPLAEKVALVTGHTEVVADFIDIMPVELVLKRLDVPDSNRS